MRRSIGLDLLIVKMSLCLLIIYGLTGCSQDDYDNCQCLGQFGNTETGEYMYQQTDCDRTPPSSEWVFIKCVDKPDY